ncbi:hypothetical protein D9758_012729 [Tetrapyrgos nigripes]|uniref:Uncharacterized protein n=1 Tax=Tetrapyrgos nigripes TaxID=182062 RepID=A0A8H5FTX4_9AGAR|nr:hypothetical protein D9758_012729 [Tetrapyrgos nigripes]
MDKMGVRRIWLSEGYGCLKAMLHLHLELSRNSPLYVSLMLFDSDHSVALYVLKVLSAHSSRWTSLYLCSDVELLKDPVLSSVRGNLPLLRQLDIDIRGDSRESIDIFQYTPALEKLSIEDFDLPSPTAMITFPWNQLNTLVLRYCYTSVALQYFDLAPQARHIALARCQNSDYRERPETYPQVMHCHNLQSLSINIDDVDPELLVVFNFHTLPSLSRLKISGANNCGILTLEEFSFASEHGTIVSFLARSRCHLVSLCLERLPLRDNEVLALLQNLLSLTELTIHEHNREECKGYGQEMLPSPLTSNFFKSLTVNYTTPRSTLLPHLKELDLLYKRNPSPPQIFST